MLHQYVSISPTLYLHYETCVDRSECYSMHNALQGDVTHHQLYDWCDLT